MVVSLFVVIHVDVCVVVVGSIDIFCFCWSSVLLQ